MRQEAQVSPQRDDANPGAQLLLVIKTQKAKRFSSGFSVFLLPVNGSTSCLCLYL
jgi:hypothetical protein